MKGITDTWQQSKSLLYTSIYTYRYFLQYSLCAKVYAYKLTVYFERPKMVYHKEASTSSELTADPFGASFACN